VGRVIGKEIGGFLSKCIPNHYQYKSGSMRVVKRNGIKLKLDINQLIDWGVYFGLKDKSIKALFSLVEDEDKIVDIGGGIGHVALSLSRLTGSSGFVHTFEPDEINYRKLKTNVSLNSFENLHINKVGVARQNKEAYIRVRTENNRGENQVAEVGAKENKISLVSLDSFLEFKPDLIKIDVEGYETEVIGGGYYNKI